MAPKRPGFLGAEPVSGPGRFEWHRRLAVDALAGRPEARRELLDRMQCVARILAHKNARLGNPLAEEELAELVQETQVTIWRRLRHFDGLSTIETWAYGCVQNLLWRCLRLRSRRGPSLEGIDVECRGSGSSRLEFDDVHRALDLIDTTEAQVVRLRHFDYLGFREMSARLGVSVGCVKARYYRGLRRLREILEPDYRHEGW